MTNVFYARLVLNVPRIFLSMISQIFFSFLPRAPSQNIVLCDKLLAIFLPFVSNFFLLPMIYTINTV
jgi:hypothetical protein